MADEAEVNPLDPVVILTEHFLVHPENPAEDVADVVRVVIQDSANWTSATRKDVVSKALKAANHPLLSNLKKVLDTL